jgi:uncharacterized protein DUF1360
MIYFTAVVLALAVARLTRLVVKDTFPPVLWARDRLAGGWRPLTGAEWEDLRKSGREKYRPTQAIDGIENRYVTRVKWSPFWLAELITCPWCASGWITGGLTLATDVTVGLPVPWLTGLATWSVGAWLAAKS